MSSEQKLLRIKSNIEEAKKKQSEAEGALKQLLKELKENHGIKDAKEAKKMIAEFEAKIEKFNKSIKKKLVVLEEKYDLN